MTSRYEDAQRVLWNMKYACFFLSLLSIAEEVTGKKIDLLDAARHCQQKGWIDGEFTVLHDCRILSWLTGRKAAKEVKGSQYTVEKWLAKDGKSNHFRRRYFDVYNGSVTVRDGTRTCYYVYTIE